MWMRLSSIRFLTVPVLIVRRKSVVPLEGSPTVSPELCIVADTIIQFTVRKRMDDKRIHIASPQGRNFQSVHSTCANRHRCRGFGIECQSRRGILVGIGRRLGFHDRITTAACKEEKKKRCRQLDVSASLRY